MGLIAYTSSNTLTKVGLLTVVELTCRLSMWTSTEMAGWPNLWATRVASALGYCREIVHGTAVFTAALDSTGNPTRFSAAQVMRVRDLT
jgi:cytochrome b